MKHLLLAYVFLASLVLSFSAFGQDEEEFKKWKNEEDAKFQQFKDKNDQAFYEFLKHEWRGVDMFRGVQRDPIPDPVKLPVYTPPKNQPRPVAPTTPAVTLAQPTPAIPPKPVEAPAPSPVEAPAPPPDAASIDFYGADISVPLPSELAVKLHGDPGKESISGYFAAMAGRPYDRVLHAATSIRTARRLNDWGYCLLLASIGRKMYGSMSNETVLFTWFMLLKSGYMAKVGFTGGQVFLLIPVDGRLFGVPYFSFGDSQRFYAVPLDPKSPVEITQMYAYEGDYPGASTLMRFAVSELPSLTNSTASKRLQFEYGGTTYTVPVTFSKDAVRFFEYYPQSDFPVYFDGSISPGAAGSLYAAFEPILKGKSELEAVNVLLRFSQTAFGYKVDKELFGREKPMFPDEVLYYSDSNCKDRAILFSYLVRALIRLEVVGLDYPGHISTAVMFSKDVPGDNIDYQGRRYTICDPTYIGADAGMCMPQFKGVTPSVIPLKRPS
ncbi:MAG TPA: hypothetical protein VMG09_15990 [Bacteroidota bacterium]|nr:hypothetical protein [Bacteroidota bacterium]